MEYDELFKGLQEEKVRYLVCGGLAVNIYGIPRMTADIDLLIDFEEQNIVHFENTLKLLQYAASVPVSLKILADKKEREKLIREKNMIAYPFYNARSGYMSLDVLLDVPLDFALMWEKREVRKQGAMEINLVSVDHLIQLKKYSNRKQDNDDVLLLSRLLKK